MPRIAKIVLLIAGICFFSNCKKPKPVIPPTDLGFLPIDSVCKLYWAFKEGSYWVYENKKGGKNGIPGWKDTIDCSYFEHKVMAFESKYWKFTTERNYFVYKQRNKNEYGNKPEWEHTINGPEAGYVPEKPPTNTWYMLRYKWNPNGGFISPFIYPYTNAIPGYSRLIPDTTINGIQCKDVIVLYTNPDGQLPDGLTHDTEIYWAKDIGIVRYRSMNDNFWDIQIVNYKVIKQ